MPQYEKLAALSKRAHLLDGISSLLSWDQETYMPEMADSIRAEQRELLAELSHTIKTSKEFEQCLAAATTNEGHLSEIQKAALRVWKKDFDREKKLPTSFVQEFTLLTSKAIPVWQQAKMQNDFASFEPTLNLIVSMNRKKADLLGYTEHPYDALLDEYEPGCTTAQIEKIFSELAAAVKKILSSLPKKPADIIAIPASTEEQMQLCRSVLEMVGFDFSCGRLDLSAHPFSSSYHPYDSRLTTRVESHGVITQILTALHEVGHSFYDMGRPVEHQGTPLGQAVSYGIHESQSRFWETRIGRSLPFWHYFYPILQKRFPAALQKVSLDKFYRSLNQVFPSLIRTDADEVTYPLHVILRFEIEKELISGALNTKELPERWNAGMQSLLGIAPPNDTVGCLQDIHWSMGAFGYFPSYSLGNIYAAQLFDAFEREIPHWDELVRNGQFAFIKEWLAKKVWQHGRRYDGPDLIRHSTGAALSSAPFITYLQKKYTH